MKKGFTLIELLIVMGIIAILATATAVLIRPAEQFRNAREATRSNHVNTIINSVYSHVATNHDWPNCVKNSTTTAEDVVTCNDLVAATSTLPRDPSAGDEDITGYTIQGIEVSGIIEGITVRSTAPESEIERTQ